MLDGARVEAVRVIDTTTEIAGPYCTKLLADAGADVVKVERPGGDPLRTHGTGALFEFLNASKRSVLGRDHDDLTAVADVLVADGPVDVDALRRRHPALVVVTISPFGGDGPWAGRPATEFTIQAACGSIGHRGLPDQPPLAAGGRLGEWITGTYAAVGALAAVREARRSGEGDHVDVAMIDCMAVTMTTFPSVFASFAGWPPLRGTGRAVEVPSIEPTADGYVVFTTNSAQQFRDFLAMIGRDDWLDDRELQRVPGRFARRGPFLAAVHEHTMKLTTAEVLEEAASRRIPSAPVLHGATVTAFEQFTERGVFVGAPSGRFVQPRVPYTVSDAPARAFSPAPAVGEHTGAVRWEPRPPSAPAGGGWQLPLAGVRVIDCTAWWAGPAASHVLACLGADVVKVESVTRPDLMRYAGTRQPPEERWWEWGPVFHAVNTNKRGVTLDLRRPEGVEVLERLLGDADVLVENYTPRVMEGFGLGWARVHAINPDLVMVRMPAFGLDGPWRDRTGFAQTMECMSGMAWLTGFPDGSPVLVRGACDPLGAMHAVVATLVALAERDRAGGGRLVESTMIEAALNAAVEQVVEHAAGGPLLQRMGNRGSVAAPQGLYRGLGDDRWLALAIATDHQWRALRSVLGNPSWAAAPDLDAAAGRRAAHDNIDERLAEWCSTRDTDEAAELLVANGVPAAAVIPSRDVVGNPQVRHRNLFEVEHHPVSGAHELPSLPLRFSRVERWMARPSPTLGEHNAEVLGAAGLDERELARLAELGVIGDRV